MYRAHVFLSVTAWYSSALFDFFCQIPKLLSGGQNNFTIDSTQIYALYLGLGHLFPFSVPG